MTDNEVDDILQKFYNTIAEKDADAFKLYEDNKRMRDLVEQALHAREELESRHRTTLVLVSSLQTALHEKERLIAAQDKENVGWRDHIAELRALLDRPSELDHGLEDIVEDVRSLTAELRSLRHAFQYAQWCCDGWEEYALEAVVQAEARERALLQDAAAAVLHMIEQDAEEVRGVVQRAAQQQDDASSTVQHWEVWCARLESECAELNAAHVRELGDAEEALKESQEHAETLQGELSATKEKIEAQGHHQQLQQQRHAVEEESQQQLVWLLAERCHVAESRWAATVAEVREVVHLLAAAQEHRNALTEKHESVLLSQEHDRLRIAKLVKQVEQLKGQQRDAEALQQQCTSQQEELRTIKEKYIAAADKERNLRQQLHTANEAAAAKLHAAEDAVSVNQRHRFALEDRLRTTQDELKALQKETAGLRRRAEEHHATEVMLQATQDQLRETEKHSFNFQAALDALKAEQQAQRQVEEARHASELAALSEAHADDNDREAQNARAKEVAMEAALQQEKEGHAKEKSRLQQELQEWIAEVEALKQEKAAHQDQLEAERAARQLLERQHRQETSVVRSMMEQSREEAQRGPQLADLQSQLSAVAQRNVLLEEACRRSARIIAQLREDLHHEQITSRTLRQRGASPSPR